MAGWGGFAGGFADGLANGMRMRMMREEHEMRMQMIQQQLHQGDAMRGAVGQGAGSFDERARQHDQGGSNPGPQSAIPSGSGSGSQSSGSQTSGSRAATNIDPSIPPEGRALLATIGGPESAGKYNARYPGSSFDNGFADHPRIAERISSGPDAGKTSDAAGRYQFISKTWDNQANKLGLKDFSPANQDKAAWDLAQTTYKQQTGNDLLSALKSGDPQTLAGVSHALSSQWSSLPGGHQPGTNGNQFVAAYNQALQGGGDPSGSRAPDSGGSRASTQRQAIPTDASRPPVQNASYTGAAPASPTPTAAPAPGAPSLSPMHIGDSIATGTAAAQYGKNWASNPNVTAKVGATPDQVLGQIQNAGSALSNRDIYLSSGTSNLQSNGQWDKSAFDKYGASTVQQQLVNMKANGADMSRVNLLGVGPGAGGDYANDKLQDLADQYGANFKVLDPSAYDSSGVHTTAAGYSGFLNDSSSPSASSAANVTATSSGAGYASGATPANYGASVNSPASVDPASYSQSMNSGYHDPRYPALPMTQADWSRHDQSGSNGGSSGPSNSNYGDNSGSNSGRYADPNAGGGYDNAGLSGDKSGDPVQSSDSGSMPPDSSMANDNWGQGGWGDGGGWGAGDTPMEFAKGGMVKGYADGGTVDDQDPDAPNPDVPDEGAETAMAMPDESQVGDQGQGALPTNNATYDPYNDPAPGESMDTIAMGNPNAMSRMQTSAMRSGMTPIGHGGYGRGMPMGGMGGMGGMGRMPSGRSADTGTGLYPAGMTPPQITDGQGNISDGAANAIHEGMNFLGEFFGLKSAVPGDPNAAQGRQAFLQGQGAMPQQEHEMVNSMFDQGGKLPAELRNIAGLEGAYNYYLSQGQPEQARRIAASILLASRGVVAKYGDQAVAEFQKGNLKGAVGLLQDAYNHVPDGRSAKAQIGPDGTTQVTQYDMNGRPIMQRQLTPEMVLQAASGASNGTLYWQTLQQAAGEKVQQAPKQYNEADMAAFNALPGAMPAGQGQQPGQALPAPPPNAPHAQPTPTPKVTPASAQGTTPPAVPAVAQDQTQGQPPSDQTQDQTQSNQGDTPAVTPASADQQPPADQGASSQAIPTGATPANPTVPPPARPTVGVNASALPVPGSPEDLAANTKLRAQAYANYGVQLQKPAWMTSPPSVWNQMSPQGRADYMTKIKLANKQWDTEMNGRRKAAEDYVKSVELANRQAFNQSAINERQIANQKSLQERDINNQNMRMTAQQKHDDTLEANREKAATELERFRTAQVEDQEDYKRGVGLPVDAKPYEAVDWKAELPKVFDNEYTSDPDGATQRFNKAFGAVVPILSTAANKIAAASGAQPDEGMMAVRDMVMPTSDGSLGFTAKPNPRFKDRWDVTFANSDLTVQVPRDAFAALMRIRDHQEDQKQDTEDDQADLAAQGRSDAVIAQQRGQLNDQKAMEAARRVDSMQRGQGQYAIPPLFGN